MPGFICPNEANIIFFQIRYILHPVLLNTMEPQELQLLSNMKIMKESGICQSILSMERLGRLGTIQGLDKRCERCINSA